MSDENLPVLNIVYENGDSYKLRIIDRVIDTDLLFNLAWYASPFILGSSIGCVLGTVLRKYIEH